MFRHGLGDSFQKLFCDPKLPYADTARKWLESRIKRTEARLLEKSKEQDNSGKEDNESDQPVRRSKRNSGHSDKKYDSDDSSSALTDIEAFAQLAKLDTEKTIDQPTAVYWFKDIQLEARLHHISHAVQNNEWPLISPGPLEGSSSHYYNNLSFHNSINILLYFFSSIISSFDSTFTRTPT